MTGINQGTGISVTNAGGPSPTVTHADLSSQSSSNNSGATVIQDITLDANGLGHITGIGTTNLDSRFTNASGDTMTGNLTIVRSDTAISTLRLQGSSQGSGDLFIGQSASYGGGISYNGDNNPVMEGAPDRIVFYRMDAGVKTAVFSYANSSNHVTFNGYMKSESSIFNVSAISNLPLSVSGAPERIITFDTEILDYGFDFNISNERYTAPVSGHYTFSASVSFDLGDGTDDTMYLSIRKNAGADMNTIEINPRAHTSPGREIAYSISSSLYLTAGEYVSVFATGLTADTPVIATYRNFSGHLLRAQ
ncbi:MAG: hypothetical protein GKR93_05240 [Gammaproteobacteria bacterium]|nr:hypothetical protein [Gammaproteobacteria bacterium]